MIILLNVLGIKNYQNTEAVENYDMLSATEVHFTKGRVLTLNALYFIPNISQTLVFVIY